MWRISSAVRQRSTGLNYANLSTSCRYRVKTFNGIAPEGIAAFPPELYSVGPDVNDPHAIMLNGHALEPDDVPTMTRAVAQCGVGTSNVPVSVMTDWGIPVFNSPGANANAVKELVVCSLLLASRGIIQGIEHTKNVYHEECDFSEIKQKVAAQSHRFHGREIAGKTLGVLGLGSIGGTVAEAALNLGMKIVAFDPSLSVEAAWRLRGDQIVRVDTAREVCEACDYLTIHVPYMDATHHLLGAVEIENLKRDAAIINLSRGDLVDSAALKRKYDDGSFNGRYISDSPLKDLHKYEQVTLMPHLGACTKEAEILSATMAVREIRDFLEHGIIKNSVNFPQVNIAARTYVDKHRLCVIHKNQPGLLGAIATVMGKYEINITQQQNCSDGPIAYTVMDTGVLPRDSDTLQAMQVELASIPGILSNRVLDNTPGSGYTTFRKP